MDRLGEIGDRVVILADARIGDAAGVIGFGAVRVALDDVGQGGDICLRRFRRNLRHLGNAGARGAERIAVFASRKAQRRQQKCGEDGASKQWSSRCNVIEMQVLDQSV